MSEHTETRVWEWIDCLDPFRIGRRVRWAECDPAGVAHTGRFPDFLLSAAELYLSHLLEAPAQVFLRQNDFVTPARALQMTFKRAMSPNQVMLITPYIQEILTTDFVIAIEAVDEIGDALFSGSVTLVTIPSVSERRSMAIPESARRKLHHGLRV
jgi:acyl-CoA thioesterase FadM